ncbi:MAG TPA: bifunctional hydroxymethylpyrimidine kinase/phosphomethylpyrimidine kinase [Candidatus Nitrosotalea sp.]|nr:bifunctional hydroxymethylpyrimidine kinase/phosphomethylpyrimidine kinase [Candidatus Nitrosotalea sp.]
MNVLTIAGSDPSSGAGIQGDIKTFTALGVYGLSVVTALTSQNSWKFFKSEPVSPEFIKSQLKTVLSDFNVSAVKIGMVYDKKTIRAIYSELKNLNVPIVLDPVFQSTTDGVLLQEKAFSDFKKFLIPISYIITPNIPEAEKISGIKIRTKSDAKKAALKINSMGAKNVVIKGGHLQDDKVSDLLLENKKFFVFSQKRLPRDSHGGGCIFSAALCASIAKGKTVSEAVRLAQEISFESIKGAARVGTGLAIARQKNTDKIEEELSSAISQFVSIKGIHEFIPEVQTNFVYSKPKPRSIYDILGLEGRLVKTGDSVAVAGMLKYGGSRHVANAVLEVAKKFPVTRSAINIRYDKKTIQKAISKRFRVSHYDRMLESHDSKKIEGKTVSWGIKTAIADLKSPPDITYHMGDLGKEPMILIFGKTPKDVLTKLAKIR